MPATGVSGLDLYVKENGQWRWLANGRPTKRSEEQRLVTGLSPKEREFILYLPLYNGVEEVKFGVAATARLEPSPTRMPAKKPIVFYGTSILQGGCAARPGMAYPSILGRRLEWPTINLGFSGSAKSEPEVAALLAELDPAVYVLDPLPNMSADIVAERIEPMVLAIRKAHPQTPIVLVEDPLWPTSEIVSVRREQAQAANARLREAFQRLTRAGQKRLFYFRADRFFGSDGEATVDGTHPTDLGFLRMADAIEPTVKRALKASR
jgi:lysophospholipase L1-like esterase